MAQQQINVEALKSQLLHQKTTTPRFRWFLHKDQALALLTAAYMAEVEYRHRKPIMDETTLQNLSAVTDFLTGQTGKCGMVLCGLCGNGKTTTLSAIQNATNYLVNAGHYNVPAYKDYNIGLPILDTRKIIQLRSKDYSQFERWRNSYMLAIDDLGTEPTEVLDYGNVISPIVELLEYRYNAQLFTILTTNVAPKQFESKYGTRLADRFREMMHIVSYKQPSYRQ